MQKLTLLGRETQLGQIIVNLINNAFDAVKDLPSPWISIQLKEDLSKVILEVKDSGPGVPHDIVSKIFDPFFTTKDVGKGTGLGLSLCRSFAEQHGGTLVFDHSDQVSCFRLEIPKNN